MARKRIVIEILGCDGSERNPEYLNHQDCCTLWPCLVAEKICFADFPDAALALVHQVRNFGEDLWRDFEQPGLGDVSGVQTVDRAVDRLTVRVLRRSKIGVVRCW